jgi:hypothetical protein
MTGMELAVIPTTGEVISLDDPASCARALYEIKELEQRIRDLKAALRESIVNESVRVGGKTLHFGSEEGEGGYVAKISTPNETRWDYNVLLELVDAGLPEERFNELVLIEQSYKIDGSLVRQLSGANPVYAEILTRAKEVIPRSPTVSVSPGKAGA